MLFLIFTGENLLKNKLQICDIKLQSNYNDLKEEKEKIWKSLQEKVLICTNNVHHMKNNQIHYLTHLTYTCR